jgi:multimeric flavodoxin WrbA
MVKVLGIMGSPRFGGNTDLLLDSALAGAEEGGAEIEKIFICDLHITPCMECMACDITGECVQADDMRSLYPKLIEADRLFFASPIFFMGISAQAKALIDRCQCLWVRKYRFKQIIGKGRAHRKGFFMSVGGTPNPEKFMGAVKCVRAFFATLDITYEEELMIADVDEKGAIEQHPTALADARRIGKEVVME